MFIPALFIIAKKWQQSTCTSINEWANKMQCRYTVEYYTAIKRNEELIHAATWMNPETITANERSQP